MSDSQAKILLVIISKMCDSFKKFFSSSYILYHEVICLRLLLDLFVLSNLSQLSLWIYHKHIVDHMFLVVFGARNVHKHEMFPTRERKQTPLRWMNFPEQRKDALLWNSTVTESEHTRSDLSVQPQGHNFQFRKSPKRGFQN